MSQSQDSRFISLLRWSERYTKTDMVYLVQGASWLTLTQLIASASSFILIFVLANALTAEALGEYRFLMTGFTLVCIFALPGMRTALRESVPKGYRGNLTVAFRAMFRWGMISSIFALVIALYYFINANHGLAAGFLVIALVAPLYNAATGYIEYLIAIKALRESTLYNTATRIITLIATLLAVFIFPQYAWAILAASILGTLIPNLIFHNKTLRKHSHPDDPVDPGLVPYSKHMTAMTALGLVAGQADKILVWNVLGAEALAIFYIAYAIPQNITANLNTIPTLAFAKFGEKDPRIIRQTLLPKIFKYFLGILVTTIIYITMAPFIFNWFFSTYTDAIAYSIVLAMIPLFGACLPIKTYLTTTKSTKQLYIVSVVPPLLRIVTAVLLIGSFGLWGAVYSLIIEGLTRSALLVYFFIRSPRY